MQKAKRGIELLSHIAVLVSVSLAFGVVAGKYYRSRHLGPQLERGLKKQNQLASLQGFDYSRFSRTLVIALNARNTSSNASVPFYNRLAQLPVEAQHLQVVAVFPNTEDEVRHYVAQNGLVLSPLSKIDLHRLNIDTTPTVVLVDSAGQILDFWSGNTTSETEREILGKLTTEPHEDSLKDVTSSSDERSKEKCLRSHKL